MLASATTASATPAAGAPIGQIIIATGSATALTLALLWLCIGHQNGTNPILGRLAAFSERTSGLPGWAALPLGLGGGSLFVALLGMYWDISLHIDNGRDPGPLANPAHYLILAGLYGIFTAGLFSIVLPRDESPGPAALNIARSRAPVGGVLMFVCGAFALIGFPLDDMWHRLFGQDVTLWGPTHLMLFGGASLTLIGQSVLLVEGMKARPERWKRGNRDRLQTGIVFTRRAALMGGLLIGLSTLQGEFDFGVAQFRDVFHPLLIATAAGVGLVAARQWLGTGGALGAAIMFLITRGLVNVIVGKVFGQTFPALPLYLPEALCVEAAGLFLARRRPLAHGLVSGALIGTLGFAAEYAWTNLVFRLPWTPAMLPEGLILAVVGGMAGGALGSLLASGLKGRLPAPHIARPVTIAAFVALALCAADGLIVTTPKNGTATVTVANVRNGISHETTVRLHPASLGKKAYWLTVTAWQGHGHAGNGLDVQRLHAVGDGVYRTTAPVPMFGEWKTFVRIQKGRQVIGVPIRMPSDQALTGDRAKAIPAPSPTVTRTFVHDQELLQRERKPGVSPWLWTAACIVVGAFFVVFFLLISLGVGRVARTEPRPDDTTTPPPSPGRFDRSPARSGQPASA